MNPKNVLKNAVIIYLALLVALYYYRPEMMDDNNRNMLGVLVCVCGFAAFYIARYFAAAAGT